MHSRTQAALLTLALHGFACSGDTSSECVEVDEQLGEPIGRQWCEGEFSPPPWNGESAGQTRLVCFEPEADGGCKLCPREDVVEAVETKMREQLAEYKPNCDVQHWEFGCMRTVENAKMLGWEEEYCCFQVAVWGSGCNYP